MGHQRKLVPPVALTRVCLQLKAIPGIIIVKHLGIMHMPCCIATYYTKYLRSFPLGSNCPHRVYMVNHLTLVPLGFSFPLPAV